MLKSLIACTLGSFLVGCSATPPTEQAQSTPSPTNSPTVPTSQVTPGGSSQNDIFPVIQFAPIIPSVISAEEITIREQQITIAKQSERLVEVRSQAGLGTQLDINRAKYFRLTNEIQLLQAKQLLALKQQAESTKAK